MDDPHLLLEVVKGPYHLSMPEERDREKGKVH